MNGKLLKITSLAFLFNNRISFGSIDNVKGQYANDVNDLMKENKPEELNDRVKNIYDFLESFYKELVIES